MLEVSVGLGVVISLFFLETFGVTAGGIIVSGYIALFLHKPMAIVATLLISFVVYIVVQLLGKVMFIYGRRRMVISILLGFILGWATRRYGIFAPLSDDYLVSVIGFIIPGLIANSMSKQDVIKPIAIMIVAAVIVRLLLVLIFEGQIIV